MDPLSLPPFRRGADGDPGSYALIGAGSAGGKATGLTRAREILASRLAGIDLDGLRVAVPPFVALSAELFADFVRHNRFDPGEMAALPDRGIALAFQQAEFPPAVLGDLRALAQRTTIPLAVRSSSLLEDAMYRPFAGVYATKMIPNHWRDPDTRFRKLLEAIKFVYASTWFSGARDYLAAAERAPADERMGVVVQEVVGRQQGGPPGPDAAVGSRFYPDLSGVARSFNFYPAGQASAEEGVVSLALGLGKSIVEGEKVWSYSPALPRANPPYNTVRDLLNQTQTRFWCVNMARAAVVDPARETEYLLQEDLETAEEDGVLGMMASTYSAESDRLVSGIGAPGPRALTFAPLLVSERVRLNDAVKALLAACERVLGAEVEIEFAATFAAGAPFLGFLQVRPLVVTGGEVVVEAEDLLCSRALVSSSQALGNGATQSIQDIVYLKPEAFDRAHTREMVSEVGSINRLLVQEKRPYLLIGFGRWGTADPWLGIPAAWGDISGARAIAEASLPDLPTDPSQGSHFFHNLTSFGVLYLTIPGTGGFSGGPEGANGAAGAPRDSRGHVDWAWLASRTAWEETRFVRAVRLAVPLEVRVDGRSGRGVVLRSAEEER